MDICSEKIRLTQEYHDLTMAYSNIVAMLSAEINRLSRSEYEKRRKMVENAGEVSAQARKQLDRHVEQHRCD